MPISARAYFLERVLPAFEDFVAFYSRREMGLRRDTHRAAAAAGSLRDLPEHVFPEVDDPSCATGYEKSKEYRESFWTNHQSYQIVCNFADASKHRTLSRSDALLSSIHDIIEYHVAIRYHDELGFYYGTRKLLTAKLKDGREIDLAQALKDSMILWSYELLQRKLIPVQPPLPDLPPYYQSRADSEALRSSPIRVFGHAKEFLEVHQHCCILDDGAVVPRAVRRADLFEHKYNLVFDIRPSPVDENPAA